MADSDPPKIQIVTDVNNFINFISIFFPRHLFDDIG